MKKILLFFWFLSIMSGFSAWAEQSDPNLKPVLVSLHLPAWDRGPRIQSPQFALYNNGVVIFENYGINSRPSFFTLKLKWKEFHNFLSALSLDDPTLYQLKNHYSFSRFTDMAWDMLYIWNGEKRKKFDLYGSYRSVNGKDAVPGQLYKILDQINQYKSPAAKAWAPSNMEILLDSSENSGAKPLSWPAGWPDLNSPETRRLDKYNYIVFLNYSYLNKLEKIAKSINDGTKILINGKKCYLSYRIPFPCEDWWESRN